MTLPLADVPPVSFATVNNEPEPVEGVLQHSVIMVEEVGPDKFAVGKPHLIETVRSLIVR